jgi:GNAT superfamily N-acetyltransferase
MPNINIDKIKFGFPSKSDVDEIIDLFAEITDAIVDQNNWGNYTVDAKREDQKLVIEMIMDLDDKIFIGKYNGEIVAGVNVEVIRNIRHGWQRAHVEEIVVKKGYRGKGIGTALMNHVIAYCRAHGIRVIKLMCGEQLKDSQCFYEKLGFVSKDKGYRLEI